MTKKAKFRDVYYGLRKLRDFLLGRKYTLHNRFPSLISPRTIPEPDVPKSTIVKYSDNYYVQRHAFDSVRPPVIAPVAEGSSSHKVQGGKDKTRSMKPDAVCFSCAPTPGPAWWWDGHCRYVDEAEGKKNRPECAPGNKNR